MIVSQILVSLSIILAIIYGFAIIWNGGLFANPADSKWSEWRNWSWYMWLGVSAIVLWIVGMFLASYIKG